MGSRKTLTVVTIPLLLGSLVASAAMAQSPTYGVGRTPTEDELRQMDSCAPSVAVPLPGGSSSPVGPIEMSIWRSSSSVGVRPTP